MTKILKLPVKNDKFNDGDCTEVIWTYERMIQKTHIIWKRDYKKEVLSKP
jgi:hypothetical protein